MRTPRHFRAKLVELLYLQLGCSLAGGDRDVRLPEAAPQPQISKACSFPKKVPTATFEPKLRSFANWFLARSTARAFRRDTTDIMSLKFFVAASRHMILADLHTHFVGDTVKRLEMCRKPESLNV